MQKSKQRIIITVSRRPLEKHRINKAINQNGGNPREQRNYMQTAFAITIPAIYSSIHPLFIHPSIHVIISLDVTQKITTCVSKFNLINILTSKLLTFGFEFELIHRKGWFCFLQIIIFSILVKGFCRLGFEFEVCFVVRELGVI